MFGWGSGVGSQRIIFNKVAIVTEEILRTFVCERQSKIFISGADIAAPLDKLSHAIQCLMANAMVC